MQFIERICASKQIQTVLPGRRIGCAILLACMVQPLAADLTVTQLANEGVMISNGETRVLMDALVLLRRLQGICLVSQVVAVQQAFAWKV